MARINILDQHTAELIAAGEVVERPASVAKELLENAIDAGATQITLSIRQGGVAELQISDNGSGIEAESVENAFVRHATSKIASPQDLTSIHTLGFRGEALASIASVARVELVTRTQEDEFALSYRIEGGQPQGLAPAARAVGTTFTVRDLFYNTPARMKFLKKDASEAAYVAETALHTALSHPEISFRFLRDGKQQFVTPGDGELRSAVYAALGRDFARDLLEVDGQSGPYRVRGLVTPPRAGRGSRSAQYFYVNGRYVKNRTMMAALENACKGVLMQGKFPGAVLLLTMPAELVDVNVHPAKTEVRFARESDVFDAVYRAVRSALDTPEGREQHFSLPKAPEAAQGKTPAAVPPPRRPGFTVMTAAQYRALGQPAQDKTPAKMPARAELNAVPAPYKGPASAALPRALDSAGEALLDILPDLPPAGGQPAPLTEEGPGQGQPAPAAGQSPEQKQPDPGQTTFAPEEPLPLRLVGEAFKTYIITERGSELCLIDKHAAHERILYERLAAGYGHVPAQMLLVPEQVTLSAAEKQAVLDDLPLLRDVGIEAEDFGGTTVLVRAVPADVPTSDAAAVLTELAARLAQGGKDALRARTEWVLHSIACRAAVKAGDATTREEMLALARRIMDGEIPPFCPHGRPCVLKITRKELEKQFGRLV